MHSKSVSQGQRRLPVFVVVSISLLFVVSLMWYQNDKVHHYFRRFLRQDDPVISSYSLSHAFVVKVTSSSDSQNSNIEITRENETLWTGCKACFVQAAIGDANIQEERGSFLVKDKISQETDYTTITSVDVVVVGNDDSTNHDRLIIQGDLLRAKRFLWFWKTKQTYVALSYRFEIFTDSYSPTTQLSFTLSLVQPADQHQQYNRLFLQHQTTRDEKIFGFGEQFSNLNMQGKQVTIISSEGGIARGKPSLFNFLLSLVGVNGNFDSTYAPAPYYMTSRSRAFFLENYEISQFDMRDGTIMVVKLLSNNAMRGRWIYSGGGGETSLSSSPFLAIIESYTEYTGRMQPLPAWMNRGAVVGLQGGTDRVMEIYDQLTALNTPLAAFWLQDWVGKRQTSFGSQLWWNWQLNEAHYPRWQEMVATLQEQDIRVMTYINPFLVDIPEDYPGERLYDIAKEKGYFVLDKDGIEPYSIGNTDFSASLVDLTNPDARDWMKGIIQANVIGAGVSGWMADFGEALPVDAVLASGVSGEVYHNQYPEEWARLNQEAVASANRTGDIVFFTRSGYTKSPGLSTLFWEGDQMVSWDKYDGLKSAITGLLSSGLSGFSLNHNDIGGYTTVTVPYLLSITRSRELLLRWMEMNAFTAVFRTHEGIQPDKNHQFYSDSGTLEHFAKFSKVYAALSFYREELMNEAAERGYPLIRHPFLHYPNDPVAFDLEYHWMLGSEFLIVPVTEENQVLVRAYLPEGSWTHIWSRAEYIGGRWYDIDSPIGSPAVFFRSEGITGETFLQGLLSYSVI